MLSLAINALWKGICVARPIPRDPSWFVTARHKVCIWIESKPRFRIPSLALIFPCFDLHSRRSPIWITALMS